MAKAQRSEFQALTYKRRKQEIVDASLTVFKDRGCFGFRVEDVAAQAGVAKGSVYAHFESRTEILQSAFEQMENRLLEEYDRKLRALPPDASFGGRLALLAQLLLRRDAGGCSNSIALLRRLPCALENSGTAAEPQLIRALIVPLIQEGQRLGLVGKSIPPLGLAHMFLSIVTCSFMQQMAHGGCVNSGQVPRLVADFFIRGASTSGDDSPPLSPLTGPPIAKE